eukprot:s3984_g3.t1
MWWLQQKPSRLFTVCSPTLFAHPRYRVPCFEFVVMAWSRARPACPAWCAVAVLAVILYRAIDGCTEAFLSPPRQAVNRAAGASGALMGLGAAAPAAHAFEMPNLGQFFSTVWRVVSTGSDEVYDPTTEEGAKALGLAVPLPKDGFGEVTSDDVLPFALFLLALVAWGLLVVPSNMDRSDGAKSVLFPSQVPKLQARKTCCVCVHAQSMEVLWESPVFELQLLASSSPLSRRPALGAATMVVSLPHDPV